MIPLLLSLLAQCDAQLPGPAKPLHSGGDYTEVPGPQGNSFYVVYSSRDLSKQQQGGTNQRGLTFPDGSPGNNASMVVLKVTDSSWILFGTGYGDHNVALRSAGRDAASVDHVVRECLGITDPNPFVLVFVPHSHADHINNTFLVALEVWGHQVEGIYYHRARSPAGLLPWFQDKLRPLTGSACEVSMQLGTTAGRIRFRQRHNPHSAGTFDAILTGPYGERPIILWGAVETFACGDEQIPRGRQWIDMRHNGRIAWGIDCHGNVQPAPEGW